LLLKIAWTFFQSEGYIKSCGRYYVIQQQQHQKDFGINFQPRCKIKLSLMIPFPKVRILYLIYS